MFRSSVIAPLLLASATAGAACTAQSGADRPHVVELYTSEGCDSCPPAERWMSTLRKHSDLIGLEFHVDYWDGADFRDPFSDHAYTQRQQALARRDGHQTDGNRFIMGVLIEAAPWPLDPADRGRRVRNRA